MGKKLRNLTTMLIFGASVLIPKLANAQSLPSKFLNSKPIVGKAPLEVIHTITKNGATPLEVIGNPYNPWVAVDDTNTYNSYKDWIANTTRDERIAYINQIVKEDDLDTKVDSLKKNVGWICGDIVNEMQLKIGQIANEDEFVKTANPSGGSFFKGNSVKRIPVYQFSTVGPISKSPHFVNGALVGDSTGNMNPTNFNAWYFWSDFQEKDVMNIRPGDGEMGDGPVDMGLTVYGKSTIDNKNYFDFIGGIIHWDLKNGVATLKNYSPHIILEDPNKIKVNVEKNLENLVVDSKKTKDLSPQNLESMGYKAIPNYTIENTSDSGNLSYFDSDTTWSSDSTNYTFNRDFYSWNYEGGITKLDSSSQKITLDNITAIDSKGNIIPEKFKVYQNYPNPFNPSTTIEYQLDKPGNVKLEIYNILGQKVYEESKENVSSGINHFKGIDFSKLSSGNYIYRITSGENTEIKKMTLLK